MAGVRVPDLPIICGPQSVVLRRSVDADGPFVRHLFETTRSAAFAALGLPRHTLDALLDFQFRDQSSSFAAQYPGAVSVLIEQQARSIGRLLLHCDDLRWHVIDIALLAAERRKGVGTAVMQSVETAARGRGVGMLTLTVLVGHADARRFYARLGFADIDAAPGDSHLAMIKRLQS